MDAFRRSIRHTARVVWTAAAAPVVAAVWWSEGVPRSPALLGEAASATILGLALHLPRLPALARDRVIVGALGGVAVFALLHFGPLLGTGLLFVLPPLFATVLLGEAAAWSAWATLAVAAAAVAGATSLGAMPARAGLGPADWVRIVGTTAVGLGGCTWVFVHLHRTFVRAVAAEADARRREQQAADERARLVTAAAATQRMESLGRLAGGVAHEVNNALLVIRAGVEHLRGAGADERAVLLEEVVSGVDRATGLARQLLAFSRRDVVEAASSRPEDSVATVAGALRRLFPEDVRVLTDVRPTTGSVSLSVSALEQVLLALALRARDALPTGGTVTLGCGDAPDDRVRLWVVDDGPALTASEQDRLFEPFGGRTVASDGLGLALAWTTVRRAGGSVEVEVAGPGGGTRISLHLPASRREPAPAPVAEPTRPAVRSAHVLLLEDEEVVRKAMVRTLHRAGHTLHAHGTVTEALDALERRPYDLLVTDAVVPQGRVSSLIRAFQERCPGAPVLVVSGYLEEDLVLESVARGSWSFLQKPFAPAALAARVDGLLAAPTSATA